MTTGPRRCPHTAGFIVNLPTLSDRGWFKEGGFGPQHFSLLFYLNELAISDEMIGREITVIANLAPGQPPVVFEIGGEEVLAHLGYALNCSRIGDRADLACAHDILVPLGGVIFFVGLAMVLLRVCVKDPH